LSEALVLADQSNASLQRGAGTPKLEGAMANAVGVSAVQPIDVGPPLPLPSSLLLVLLFEARCPEGWPQAASRRAPTIG
jgi:hypothetical protein